MRTISELNPGATVWVDETVSGNVSHTPYIYLGLDESGNARLLRKFAALAKRMHSSNVASYAGCEADVWMENEETGFLSRLDDATKGALVATEIRYRDFNSSGDGTASINTIARRCFLLSGSEEGFYSSPDEGKSYLPALYEHYGVTSANTARISRSADGNAVYAWCRSANSAANFVFVLAIGNQLSNFATNTGIWLRPALSVAPATIVSDEGADEIWLLPDSRTAAWVVDAIAYPGSSDKRPAKVKVTVPVEGSGEIDIQVANNAKDAAPAWVGVENGGVATLGSQKTTDKWEIGVKIHAEFSKPTGTGVYEPFVVAEMEE